MNAEVKTIDADKAVTILPEAPRPRDVSPLALLDRAMERGLPVETMRELMTLQREHEADQARKAFSVAFAAFKAEAVKVVRNRRVTDGPLKGKSYAELTAFVEAAVPMLSKHGLSHSWTPTKDEKDWIEITCTIEHVDGGRKTASLGGPPDTGGAKNALQARISTVTYLERATFKAVCGLAELGDDDDGKGGAAGPAGPVNDDEFEAMRAKIVEVGADLPRFLKTFSIERLEDMPASRYGEAMRKLAAKAKATEKAA